MTTLRRLASTTGGAGFPHAEQGHESGDLPFVKVSDFNHVGNERVITTCNNWVTMDTARRLRATVVPPGSVLLPKVGAALLGNARRITSRPSVFDNNILGVVPRDISSRYLHYLLTTVDAAQFAKPGPVPSMDDGAVLNLRVPIVSLHRQRAIADYLDTETSRIDTLITKKRRMIELLGQRWRNLRRQAILRGLNPVLGGGLVEPWDEMNLGVLIELQRGHDLPSSARVEGDVPVVSSGGVSGWHNAAIADGPGVITGRCGTIGEVFYVEEPYWPLNTTLYVKDFRRAHPGWVYHLLAAIPLDIDSQKTAVGAINRNFVGALRVPRPSVATQRELARYLNEAEEVSTKALKRLQAQIDLLSERRRALITATVTGESVTARHKRAFLA